MVLDLHHESSERAYQGGYYGPSRKFSLTFVFLYEAIHPKDWPMKDS
jgi:hypothetical protein